MRASTIVYIKDMLESRVDQYREMAENARKALIEAEQEAEVSWSTPDDKVPQVVRDLRERKREKKEKFDIAFEVMADFNIKEWN